MIDLAPVQQHNVRHALSHLPAALGIDCAAGAACAALLASAAAPQV